MDTVKAARRFLGAALCIAALGACAHKNEVTASGPYARDVAEDIPIIERGTGLTFKKPPVLEMRTKAQVRQFLEAQFTDHLTDQEVQGQSIFYKRLGLLPDTLDLKAFMLDLLTEQVAGFYDPHSKVLYVVDSAPPDEVGFVIQHELVHALQDQYVNLDSLQHVHNENDRALAAQAVIEGQATLVPIQATLGPGAGLPGGWDRVRDMIRDSRANGMAEFHAAPELLQETLIFPYLSGAEFVRDFELRMPGKQPYGPNMPTSTSQVLHPTTFFTKRQEPLDVEFPKPSSGTVTYSDDVGEFETRLFLFQFLQVQNASMRGAAGWAGDQYEVITFPSGDGIAWLTLWNTAVQSAEFGNDVEDIIGRRFNKPAGKDTPAGKVYSLPNGRTITLWGGTVDGHPAVLYTDLPSRESPAVVRLDKVRVTAAPL
ncbi:MAG TPA: hypothetical protein VN607_02805 [Gemmatimonadaceae bacterium]|nr:hypothetical protein [Gemmatimonadaceae bacterium]